MFRALIRLFGRGTIDPAQLQLPLGLPLGLPGERPSDGPPPPVRLSPPPALSTLGPRLRTRPTPAEADAAIAAKLCRQHAEYNASRFGGSLKPISITLSRRLRSRLAYYRLATPQEPGLIVISRRHMRRHGWVEVCETLLHEMVHQWQDESQLSVDHGKGFRIKARAVGAHPRARRPVER